MNILRLLPLLFLVSVLGAATEIQSYHLRLATARDGSGRGFANVQLSGCMPGQMNLPLGFSKIEDLKLESAPKGVRLELGPSNGQLLLHFFLPEGVASEAALQFSFAVPRAFQVIEPGPGEKSAFPAGSRIFRHAFVNTQEATIGSYRFELIFPEETMAQAIREQLPKPKKAEVGPRVLLSKIEGRQAATLQFAALKQGDDTSMQLELVPVRKSFGWLIVGLLLAGAYLYYFRDIVLRREASIPS
jgi:hypothetical protein